MAATRVPAEALELARQFVKQMPVERVVEVLDSVHKRIWMAAPWRWTVGVCEPVALAAETSDFNVASSPADFLYILKAYIWDGESLTELTPEPALPSGTTQKGNPNKIAYVPGVTPKFRIHPVFGSINTAKTYRLLVWYKKTAPVLTGEDIYTAGSLVMDDEWFNVFEEGVLWKCYQFGDDPRAGNVAMQQGQAQYSGQRAVFEDSLQFMRSVEPMLTQYMRESPPEMKKVRG